MPTSQTVQQQPSLITPQDMRPRDVERFFLERLRPQQRPPIPCQDVRHSVNRNGKLRKQFSTVISCFACSRNRRLSSSCRGKTAGGYPNHPALQQLNNIPPQTLFPMSGNGFPQRFTHAFPGNPMYPQPYPYPKAVGYSYTSGGWAGGYPYYNVSQMQFPQMGNWGN